jgi:hypothetical protein
MWMTASPDEMPLTRRDAQGFAGGCRKSSSNNFPAGCNQGDDLS